MFRALMLERNHDGVAAGVRELEGSDLPAGDVTVEVRYASLNYKDGMVLRGIGRMVREYPHVPGIDLAGVVERSDHPDFSPGDPVLLTGLGVGERHWGGYTEQARVSGDWLVPLPEGLTLKRAMALGTAGFTAMLATMTLEEHGLHPGSGEDGSGAEPRAEEVLITGAGGGVGSVAVALLSTLGYRVAASTGRPRLHEYLHDLGAERIVGRQELSQPPERPLESRRWAGCIDSVGGTTLARVISALEKDGSVAAVGLAGGNELHGSILPFLLRGVNLLGIDSNECPMDRRLRVWRRLAAEMPMDKLDQITSEAGLGELPNLAERILEGGIRGRVVVDVTR
jgi:acrylyl-CoA reductase (NADPH)